MMQCALGQLSSEWHRFPFRILTLLVRRQEGQPACWNWPLVCWWWKFDWSFAFPV